MGSGENKGWMSTGMKFGTADAATPEERGPMLPLRLLVVADLVPREPHNAGASAPEGVIRVDLVEFDDLFKKLRPRLALDVPSVLAEGKNARVDLAPTSLKSFRPDGLVFDVPLLRSLLDGRIVLERLRDGSMKPETAMSELERLWSGSRFAGEVLGLIPSGKASAADVAMPPPPKAPETSSVDSLLDMVDLGPSYSAQSAGSPLPAAAPKREEGNKFSSLIAQFAMSGKGGTKNPSEAIARVEKAIAMQLGAILQHPEVRRLEEVWRGLRFLVERTKGHTGARVEVICARPDEAAEALARALRTRGDEPPITCAIVDVTIDGSAPSLALLEKIAEVAEANTVPVIVEAAPKLLGVASLRQVESLDNKAALFEAPARVTWRSTAAKGQLRWVTLATNRMLARPPFDRQTSRVREAIVKELPDDDSAWVWLDAVWGIGALVLESFRQTGWPCRLLGPRGGGQIENLPVREVKAGEYDGDDGIAIPTEAFLSTDTQKELARMGVLALAAAPNSDAALVLHAPTAYVPPPKRTYDSATTEPEARFDKVSLVDQLFVARLVQFLRALCSKIPPKSDPAEVQPVMQAALWELFDGAKPGSVELTVKARAESDGTIVSVTLSPRHFLGVGLDEISLDMPLG